MHNIGLTHRQHLPSRLATAPSAGPDPWLINTGMAASSSIFAPAPNRVHVQQLERQRAPSVEQHQPISIFSRSAPSPRSSSSWANPATSMSANDWQSTSSDEGASPSSWINGQHRSQQGSSDRPIKIASTDSVQIIFLIAARPVVHIMGQRSSQSTDQQPHSKSKS
ncbi:hypothetical protein ACLOJK_023364 [Asimina triloba]